MKYELAWKQSSIVTLIERADELPQGVTVRVCIGDVGRRLGNDPRRQGTMLTATGGSIDVLGLRFFFEIDDDRAAVEIVALRPLRLRPDNNPFTG